MSIQINKSAYEKLIKEDIEWLLSNTKDSLERRHIVEVLNYSPERLYTSGSSEIPNDLEEAAQGYEKKHTYQRYDGGGFTPEYDATLAEAVIFGAKLHKEQMMKEAVEGIAHPVDCEIWVNLVGYGYKFKEGDKVKLIIVKED